MFFEGQLLVRVVQRSSLFSGDLKLILIAEYLLIDGQILTKAVQKTVTTILNENYDRCVSVSILPMLSGTNQQLIA